MSEVITFCRICEAFCGLVATVEDGRLVGVRGDRDNPYTQGFLCTKGVAMVDVTYDEDRVVQPLRRGAVPGEFTPVSWDEALDDIATRLNELIEVHGPNVLAVYQGNPPAFDAAAMTWISGFLHAIGS